MKKRSLSKALSLLLVSLCLGLAAAGCAKKEEPAETTETTEEVKESSEESKEESKESTEDVIENVDYIYAVNDNDNIVIENEGYDALKAAIKEFNQSAKEYGKSKGIGEGSEYQIYNRVLRADSKVFSIVSEEAVYTDLESGFGESNRNFSTVNYNSSDGKELNLSDVADEGIYKVLTDELKASYPSVKFVHDTESKLKEGLSKQGWDSKASWALSYDGIIFYIQKDLVSADGAGVLVYSVSFNEHKDIIKQSYTSKPESYIYPIFVNANYPIKIGDKVVRLSVSTDDANDYETVVNIDLAGKKNSVQYMYTPSNMHLINVKGDMFMLIQVPVGDVSYFTDVFKLDDNGVLELNEVEQAVAESHFSNDTSHIMINTIGEGGDYNQVQSYYMEFNTDGTFKKVE